MHRRDVPIHTPCGADWSEMAPAEARTRLCAQCTKVVHDLSGRDADDVQSLLRAGPVCVRYLFDVHGRVLLDGTPKGARIISASALLSKHARTKWLAAAAIAAVPIVFEACGGNGGGFEGQWQQDAGDAATPPTLDASSPTADAADASDASVDASSDAPDGD